MTDHSTPTRQNDNSLDVLTLFTQLDIDGKERVVRATKAALNKDADTLLSMAADTANPKERNALEALAHHVAQEVQQ